MYIYLCVLVLCIYPVVLIHCLYYTFNSFVSVFYIFLYFCCCCCCILHFPMRSLYCFVCLLHLPMRCLHCTFTSVFLYCTFVHLPCVVCILHLPMRCLYCASTSLVSVFYIYLCFVRIVYLYLSFLNWIFTLYVVHYPCVVCILHLSLCCQYSVGLNSL